MNFIARILSAMDIIFTQVFNFLSLLGILLDVIQHPNGHQTRNANDTATLKINLFECIRYRV